MTDVIWPALTWPSPVRAPPEATISRLAPGARTRATMAGMTPAPAQQNSTSAAMPSTSTAVALPDVEPHGLA